VCRQTFVRIYDVDPNFDLTPAEAGHPSWTRTFAQAKAQAKKALADMASGETLKVVATDPGSVRDFQAFARQTGNELIDQRTVGDEFIHWLRRR